jgi:nitrite reductase (NADH) small subunit
MSERHNLGSLSQIPKGEGRNFKVGAQSVAVFHSRDGRVFATQASCPHRQGPLADGLLGGATLVCPLHDWRFDLTTGQPLAGECGISVYRITLEDDQLWLELPTPARAAVSSDN